MATDTNKAPALPQKPAWEARTPWVPMLTGEEVARGLDYYGSGARLRRVASKLLAGEPIKVWMLCVPKAIGSVAPVLLSAAGLPCSAGRAAGWQHHRRSGSQRTVCHLQEPF